MKKYLACGLIGLSLLHLGCSTGVKKFRETERVTPIRSSLEPEFKLKPLPYEHERRELHYKSVPSKPRNGGGRESPGDFLRRKKGQSLRAMYASAFSGNRNLFSKAS